MSARNQSVGRAFAIIEYLADRKDCESLATIARDLDLDHATTYRFLATLRDLGYVSQRADARYQLTLKFGWIASRVLDRLELRTVARPHMVDLTHRTGETSHLGVLDVDAMVYVEKIDAERGVSMRSRVGTRCPLHSTAIGKTMLAFMHAPELSRILDRITLSPLTPATITRRDQLIRDLERTRKRAFAIDNEENETGIRCVAAPIFDQSAQIVAVISLSGWTVSMTSGRIPGLAGDLKETSAKISAELGHVVRETVSARA